MLSFMEERDEDLSPSEAARERRRDRDAEAHARAGMRTGLAKQFKQVLDTQRKRAEETADLDEADDRRHHETHRRRPEADRD
jgi:hypothetical protein